MVSGGKVRETRNALTPQPVEAVFMTDSFDPAPKSLRRWVIFTIGSLNFVISMFYRVSTAVISPALIRDMDLTSARLSDLSAAFYYAFALSQIPLGIAIDRLGPRRTMGLLSFAAVGGALAFALGRTPGHLIAARVLLGIGMSGNMMILMALLARWFPVDRFASLSGTAIAVGAVGNLLAATPLAVLTLKIGWRNSFLLFACVNAVVVAAFILVIKDYPEGRVPERKRTQSPFEGLGRLAGMYGYWAISLTNFIRYGYFAALQSLWLGPFLMFGMGLGEIATGNALFSLGMGYVIGLPLWGSISDRVLKSRKRVVLPTMITSSLIILSLMLWTRETPSWLLLSTFFLLGFTAAPGQILYAQMKELLPPEMTARAMTSVNLFTVLGVGAMIHLLGLFVGRDPASLNGPESFRLLWIVGVGGLALVCALYAPVPDGKAARRRKP
jgi:MFS family permease